MLTITNLVNLPVRFANQCWEGIKNNKKAIATAAVIATGVVSAVALGCIMNSNRNNLNRIKEDFDSVLNESDGYISASCQSTSDSDSLENLSNSNIHVFRSGSILEPSYEEPTNFEGTFVATCLGQANHLLSITSENFPAFFQNVTLNETDLFNDYFYAFQKSDSTNSVEGFICKEKTLLGRIYEKTYTWYNS